MWHEHLTVDDFDFITKEFLEVSRLAKTAILKSVMYEN